MQPLTRKVFEELPRSDFTMEDVIALFPVNGQRRYGLVKRAIASGEVIHIRRGLYCLAPQYRKRKVNLYSLAQRINGPSYISLESALSWYGWIPEAVYTLTSVSLNRSRDFDTPLAFFSYTRVPQKVFYTSVQRITDDDDNSFLMATPLKALADYVYVNKKDWAGAKPVTESMRIDREELGSITDGEIQLLISNYNSRRVKKFLKGLERDLKS